jgi:DMSO reductase anchor subunit
VVKKDAVIAASGDGARLTPGSFESRYTRPTTTYSTKRRMPDNARPADDTGLRIDHAHWPLIFMLVLTQAAAGAYVGAVAFSLLHLPGVLALAIAGTVLLHAGLAVSVFHLGRPLGAWRFFLGLRTSWMSREILAFGVFAGMGTAYAGALWLNLPLLLPFLQPLALSTLFFAVAGLVCSSMIYVDTRRPCWIAKITFGKFFGSATVLGLYAVTITTGSPALLFAAVGAHWLLTGWDTATRTRALEDEDHPAHRSARTAKALLPGWLNLQVFAVVSCGLLAAFSTLGATRWFAVTAGLLALVAVVAERAVFFQAAASPRMPGGVPS